MSIPTDNLVWRMCTMVSSECQQQEMASSRQGQLPLPPIPPGVQCSMMKKPPKECINTHVAAVSTRALDWHRKENSSKAEETSGGTNHEPHYWGHVIREMFDAGAAAVAA